MKACAASGQPPRNPQAGLTLIEMLVVLAVVGVAAGATLFGLNLADRGARAEAEAVRLARHLTLAVDEALIAGVPLALVWDPAGYRFTRWMPDQHGWVPDPSRQLGDPHLLRARLSLGTETGTPPAPVVISASGAAPATRLVIQGAGAPWAVDFDGFTARAVPQTLPIPTGGT